MEEKGTDKKKLVRGIKFLALAIPLAFAGPSVIYSAFGNRDKPMYIPVLILGFLLSLGAGYFIMRGIKTMMRAIFND